jgi:hypothetical protein
MDNIREAYLSVEGEVVEVDIPDIHRVHDIGPLVEDFPECVQIDVGDDNGAEVEVVDDQEVARRQGELKNQIEYDRYGLDITRSQMVAPELQVVRQDAMMEVAIAVAKANLDFQKLTIESISTTQRKVQQSLSAICSDFEKSQVWFKRMLLETAREATTAALADRYTDRVLTQSDLSQVHADRNRLVAGIRPFESLRESGAVAFFVFYFPIFATFFFRNRARWNFAVAVFPAVASILCVQGLWGFFHEVVKFQLVTVSIAVSGWVWMAMIVVVYYYVFPILDDCARFFRAYDAGPIPTK